MTLHIERILCECISMAALKVGNKNEIEIAMQNVTQIHVRASVCVCVCV